MCPNPLDVFPSWIEYFRVPDVFVSKTSISIMYIPVVPGQAGGGSFHSIKKHKPIRTRWPIEKNNHPTEFLPFPRLLRAGFFFSGKRSKVIDMFFGIRMQRNQCVAHSGARTAEKRHSSLFGCDTTATRGPQRRASCRETTFWDIRMRRRQCAAHSGTRTAEQRNRFIHGCPMSNATKV